jgi:hypothetical protein
MAFSVCIEVSPTSMDAAWAKNVVGKARYTTISKIEIIFCGFLA